MHDYTAIKYQKSLIIDPWPSVVPIAKGMGNIFISDRLNVTYDIFLHFPEYF